jgi:type II secretory pathway predicted ATPase ExeA
MYNEYFGFLETPFSITPNPRFFYANPVYLEAYANLRYGIEAKKGFIAITGEVGTGKTMLLRKLMHDFDGTIHCVLIFHTDLTFNELLRVILCDLGLPAKGPDRLALVDELNAYLIEQLKKGHIVCLLIDEAQSLNDQSLEGLRMLSNLETDQEKLLQIVLVGQPELRAKLDRPNLRQLRQRIAIQCELAPLKAQEIGSYINFRLQTVGYEGKNLFHPEAVHKIAVYSKGIPRLINVICDNALLLAYAASRKTVSVDMIGEVASDLRLEPAVSRTEAKTISNVPPAKADRERLVGEAPNRLSQYQVKRIVRAGVVTLLVFGFVAVASITDPQSFFKITRRTSDLFEGNSNQSARVVTPPTTIPQKSDFEAENGGLKNSEVEPKWKNNRLIVPSGSTIYKIAIDAYGANSVLGMDLIKEFNPKIENLNWVYAGEEILLPALSRDALVRQNPDGSYRLIVASFLSRTEADHAAQRIAKESHQIIITAKRVSNDLLLHRLEIDGLKNLEEVTQVLEAERKNDQAKRE